MNDHNLSRRLFLQSAALGAAAVTVSPITSLKPLMAAPGGGGGTPGKFVVLINMLGGNDAVNMVCPVAQPNYRTKRANLNLVDNLPAGETLHAVDPGNALHYRLTGLKQLWDEGDLHIVNQVSYPSPNQSHFTSRDIWSYGVRDYEFQGDGRGWLGRFADCYWSSPSDPLGVISVGLAKQPDFRSGMTAPLILGDIPSFSIDTDTDYPEDHIQREELIRSLLMSEPTPAQDPGRFIFTTHQDTYPLVDEVQSATAGWVDPGTYSTASISRYMKTISQLLHAHGSWGTQIFYTGFGGFDTHSGQHSGSGGQNRQEGLFQQLNDAMTSFSNDMKAKGMWDDCLVVVFSEFGRRTFENGSIGTDHGHGGVMFVAGGGVNVGHTSPLSNLDLDGDYVPFVNDFRNIHGHLVQNHLGLDPTPLFPDPSFTPSFGSYGIV